MARALMPTPGIKPRLSLARSVLASAAVVIALLAGIWISGGVITNDFGLPMVLTAVWIGMAGLASLAIGRRWRRAFSVNFARAPLRRCRAGEIRPPIFGWVAAADRG